jgi:hypothetical protein
LRVWKKKGLKDLSRIDTLFNYSQKNIGAEDNKIIRTNINFKAGKKYLLRLDIKVDNPSALKLSYKHDSIIPSLYKVNNKVGYAIIETKKWPSADLILKNDSNFCNSLTILECDYLPDFYSEKYLTYDFKKLPYIWGTYDKEQAEETILFEKKVTTEINNTLAFSLNIPNTLDKSSGNSIVVSCKNSGKKIQNLILYFGKKGEVDRSSISFSVLPSDKVENYVLRVSSIYKWLDSDVNEINFSTDADKSITLEKVSVTKAN